MAQAQILTSQERVYAFFYAEFHGCVSSAIFRQQLTGTKRRDGSTHRGRATIAKRIGFGNYQYEVVENWPKVEIRGAVSNILGGVGHGLVLDRDGNEVGNWGNLASSPHGFWVNWQVFTTDGAFVSLQEHVSHPNRIALDADGTFHIAGGAGIEIWKRDGTKIGSWGEKGEAPGQFVAGSVHGAWMDTDGSLYTAEASRNNRLQKFVRV